MSKVNRTTYHVTPSKSNEDWRVKREGATRVSSIQPTQEKAIERATEIARTRGHSQVIIHRPDGRIREERTYGDDPYPPEG